MSSIHTLTIESWYSHGGALSSYIELSQNTSRKGKCLQLHAYIRS